MKSKSWHIYKGMSLYTRAKSPYYWGCLRIDKKYYKKSLKTTDINDAEKLLFAWKSELMTSPDSPVGETGNAFSAHAKKLIRREKN